MMPGFNISDVTFEEGSGNLWITSADPNLNAIFVVGGKFDNAVDGTDNDPSVHPFSSIHFEDGVLDQAEIVAKAVADSGASLPYPTE